MGYDRIRDVFFREKYCILEFREIDYGLKGGTFRCVCKDDLPETVGKGDTGL
jgi:hypothetical protein